MSAVENASEVFNVTTKGTKEPSSPEGMAVAYGSLLVMAVLPILFGSLRSVTFHNSKLKQDKNEGGCDKLTVKDAALFPFLASGVLIAMYTVFKIFSKDLINMVITGYFYFLGVLALCHLLSPVINKLIPVSIPKVQYLLKFTEQKTDNQLTLIDYKFTSYDVISFALCLVFGLWYLIKKHWIANNLFAMAFAVNGVEMLLLNRVYTAFILLCGLFVYDIFWVFYTDVMITVAKSFEAPIKLVFPQDLLENGISATNFAMLGLGDIVIPGIFIALLLRFDKSLNRSKDIYFISSFVAYIFGLTLTIFVMHSFQHAQPALLYLVPSCILAPLMLATVKGDLSAMLKYEDYPQNNAEEQTEQSETATNGSADKDDDRKNAAADSPAKVGRVPGTASPIGEKKKK